MESIESTTIEELDEITGNLDLELEQGASNLHQVYIIISNTFEELDNENNLVINPHNLERGVNHRSEGETTPREKVHLSIDEWQMIKATVHRGAVI
jgi:hypothetical protein